MILSISPGSVVVSMAAIFEDAAPSAEAVKEVVASGNQLSDDLPIVPNSVEVGGKCATVTVLLLSSIAHSITKDHSDFLQMSMTPLL